jgi:5-methylcytosine-specific restriction endonuclease McrA
MLNGKTSMRIEFATDPSAKDLTLTYHSDISCSSTDYVKVKGNKSYHDGDVMYWASRKGLHPEISTRVGKLLKIQKGKCPRCNLMFLNEDLLEVDHIIPKAAGGKDKYDNLQLLHRHCHDTKTKEDMNLINDYKKSMIEKEEERKLKINLDLMEKETTWIIGKNTKEKRGGKIISKGRNLTKCQKERVNYLKDKIAEVKDKLKSIKEAKLLKSQEVIKENLTKPVTVVKRLKSPIKQPLS